MKKLITFLNRNRWLFIAAISFFLGLIIRFYYGLNTDLWNDEAISYLISRNTTWTDLIFSKGNYGDFMHPPFYYIFLKLVLIISDVDWWLRLTSLIWFFPSIYLVYKISLLFKNRQTTFLAISLFSLHPLLINLSFQVRPYPIVITLILFTIYELCLNLTKPKLFRSVFIGLLLTLCFLISYASIWLITGISFFIVYLFFSKHKNQGQYLLYSLFTFIFLGFYQILVLLKYFLKIGLHGQIAGSVVYFNLNWFFNELSMLFGNNYIEFYMLLFFVISIFNLKKNKCLLNQLLFFLSLITIVLSIITSIIFSPNFLARQLVLFSLTTVFIFAQFHQNLRQEFILAMTLLIFGVNSVNGYNFLFRMDFNKNIREKLASNSAVIILTDYDLTKYYVNMNDIHSSVYLVERNNYDNQEMLNELLALPTKKILFVTNHFVSNAELELKQSLQQIICEKHDCADIEL